MTLKPTISRAPFHIKYSRKSDFEPEFVSIGPYYYEKKLKDNEHMDRVKDHCTLYFLKKLPVTTASSTTSNLAIDDLVCKINPYDQENRIRDWYGGSQYMDLQRDELFRLLVRDSCFLIRIILSISREVHESMFFQLGVDIKKVRFDLLLLENQIPFFFLLKVYEFFDNNKMLPPKPFLNSAHNSLNGRDQNQSNLQHRSRSHFRYRQLFTRKSMSLTPQVDQSYIEEPTSEHYFEEPTSEQYFEEPTSEQSTLQQPTDEPCPSLQPTLEQTPPPQPTPEQNPSTQPSPEQTPSIQPTPEQNPFSRPIPENNSSQQSISQKILNQFLKELEPFIGLDMPWKFNNDYRNDEEPDHLLDLYWKSCLPFPWTDQGTQHPRPNLSNEGSNRGNHIVPESWVNIHLRSNARKQIKNACELYENAGITFEKRDSDKSFGVTFQKGILQLPHLQLDPSQTKLLINLIAFEELKSSDVWVITSYVLLLDGLINTEKDVELLQRHGVISNKLGSSQTASSYFNDIGNVCTINYNDHYCHVQFDDLNRYHNSKWNRQLAKLRHKYFSSPWAFISVLAGATLLILSALQTYYNMYSYYQHP